MAVLDVTRDELTRLGVLETVEGQAALVLAESLDSPRAGMAISQDARELRLLMQVIRSAAPAKEANPIDDLIARRKARESAAKAV